MVERNPVIVPERSSKTMCCPKCGSAEFEGRRIQSTIVRTCKNPQCRQEWAGGYGMAPVEPDPRVPVAPELYTPPLKFNVGQKGVEELRRRVDLTPDFRKGAVIPPEGEEDV